MVASREFGSLNPSQRKQVVKIRDGLESIVEHCLKEGCATGEFKIKEISIAKIAIIALCRSVLTWYSPGGDYRRSKSGSTTLNS